MSPIKYFKITIKMTVCWIAKIKRCSSCHRLFSAKSANGNSNVLCIQSRLYFDKRASLLQVWLNYSLKSFIWYWFQEEAEGSPNAGHDPGEVVQKRLLTSKVIKLFYLGTISYSVLVRQIFMNMRVERSSLLHQNGTDTSKKFCFAWPPGPSVIKLFTVVIYKYP
jgi:hypothetical protein